MESNNISQSWRKGPFFRRKKHCNVAVASCLFATGSLLCKGATVFMCIDIDDTYDEICHKGNLKKQEIYFLTGNTLYTLKRLSPIPCTIYLERAWELNNYLSKIY